MKYSFLVPVYNVEQYLEQCINSMLSQTYKDFEIILVDDGSIDASGKICDNYAAKYPETVKVIHKENEGLVSARQVGIENAKGDICLFADSDDFIEKNLLEEVDNAFLQDESIDMVMYSFSYFDKNQKIQRRQTLSCTDEMYTAKNKEILYNALINTPLISSLWTKAVKTEILKNDPVNYKDYYENNMGEDWFRSIHILTGAKKIRYINRHLYNYRVDNISISRDFASDNINKKNMLYIYNRFLEYLPLWNMDTGEYKNKLKSRWLNEAVYTFSQYYKAAKTNAERKQIVDFDWSTFLPTDILENKEVLVNQNAVILYEKIVNKSYAWLRGYFIKQSIYNNYKKIKLRILK